MTKTHLVTGWTAMLALLIATPGFAAPSAQCKAYGQAALAALSEARFADATQHFSAAAASQVSPAMLESVWHQLTAQVGAFQALGQLAPRRIGGTELLAATMTFANGTLGALVDCDVDNRITTFRIVPASMLATTPAEAAPPSALPAGVVSRDVAVPSPLGPLPGVVTLPRGVGPFPAVVFAAGSRPNDRDETIGPNKPFRDIAIGLAQAGIASLRFDKRAHVYGAEMAGKPITVDDEETDDVLGALRVLAKQPPIDRNRLFVLGHSEGAMLAPRVAQRSGRLAGIVMLAAPARPLLDLLADQLRYLGELQGAPAVSIEKQEQAIDAERKLLAGADPAHPPQGEFFHAPQSFWLSLHDYSPVQVAKGLNVPMLILQGGNDYQVSPTKDFDAWKRALAGKSNVTFHLYPGLSHLFMPGPTRSPADYDQPAHVDPEVIGDIAKWIKVQPAR